VDAGQQDKEAQMTRKRTERIREGNYIAEFEITLHEDQQSPWSPFVDPEDVKMTDRIRLALRRGDVAAAAKEAQVYELLPLAGE
jgi:hypothetical protein